MVAVETAYGLTHSASLGKLEAESGRDLLSSLAIRAEVNHFEETDTFREAPR